MPSSITRSRTSKLEHYFPADFIAEGVDQTRGWFFTLHAIAVMLFDSVSYQNLRLQRPGAGQETATRCRKGSAMRVDPFETIDKYGPDATRWYMITNSQPWDNLKFDLDGITEVQRKFFGTLYNTYAFFALYANIDGFTYSEAEDPFEKRPEIDRWILSELNSLIRKVESYYDDYEPTKAGRAIQDFVDRPSQQLVCQALPAPFLERRLFGRQDRGLPDALPLPGGDCPAVVAHCAILHGTAFHRPE